MTTGADVVAEARTWIGTPWRHQGRTRHGIDCVGLVSMVAKACGLSTYDRTTYTRAPSRDSLFIHDFEEAGAIVVAFSDAKVLYGTQEGDVLVFTNAGPFPCHVGILSQVSNGTPHLIHAYAQHRKVVEQRYDGYWASCLRRVYRLPGIEG